jgi:hypothetical protein
VAGHAVFQLEDAAQEWLFRLREQGHVDRTLPAAQDGAQGDQQKLLEVVQTGIAGSRVFKILPKRGKLIQSTLKARVSHADW